MAKTINGYHQNLPLEDRIDDVKSKLNDIAKKNFRSTVLNLIDSEKFIELKKDIGIIKLLKSIIGDLNTCQKIYLVINCYIEIPDILKDITSAAFDEMPNMSKNSFKNEIQIIKCLYENTNSRFINVIDLTKIFNLILSGTELKSITAIIECLNNFTKLSQLMKKNPELDADTSLTSNEITTDESILITGDSSSDNEVTF